MTTTIRDTTTCICCKGLVPIGLALCDWCWGRCTFGEAHKQQHQFSVVDDGTLDTVLQCNDCQQPLRYNFQGSETEGYGDFGIEQARDAYTQFVEWCMDDASRTHDCWSK